MHKKILITGATGLLGKKIVDTLCHRGALVRIISGNEEKAKSLFDRHYTIETFSWDSYENPEDLKRIIEDSDAVINLSGANVGAKRWSKEYMEEIYESRIHTTELLADAIKLCDKKPECLINASGVGIYGFRGDEMLNENSSTGNSFLAKLCIDWEAEAVKTAGLNVRVVTIRNGMVLDKNEGALPKLIMPFKFFIGNYIGSGKQWISWIHIEDITSLYLFAIENKNLFGALNGTSPNPVTNKTFSETLGKILNRPVIFPVPEFALNIAVGKFAENLVTGQRVYPKKAIDAGFVFKFPNLNDALESILL